MNEFDEKTKQALGNYVYVLVDPREKNGRPFYIGQGRGNRVFDHIKDVKLNAGTLEKHSLIREIQKEGYAVEHMILRHGMNAEQALLVEASLIDFFQTFRLPITNEVAGHGSGLFGAMSIGEIKRRYEAAPLEKIASDCVIININKRYDKIHNSTAIYEATRQKWVMAPSRIGDPANSKIRIVLAEFRGIVVGVFEVKNWFQTPDENSRLRWGFNGHAASEDIQAAYLYRSLPKRRYGNPILYSL